MDNKNWPKHAAPAKLWFHYHPNPGMYSKTNSRDFNVYPASEGDLWPEPYYSQETAFASLAKHMRDDGWIVIGPYTLSEEVNSGIKEE